MGVDKATLLGSVLPQRSVEVPGVGTLTVRALSRAEVVSFQALSSADELENATLAAGMVEPSLSLEEAARWRSIAGNEDVKAVSDAILELSGLGEGAQAAKERRFRTG